MNAAEATVASTGCRWTTPAQRSAAGRSFLPERPNTLPPRKVFSRDGRASLAPLKPSRAGSSVSEAITVIATVTAAAIATPFSSDWRSTSSPSMPMTTVVPAVSTARPAVRIAVTSASAGRAPSCSSLRNLVTMNSA